MSKDEKIPDEEIAEVALRFEEALSMSSNIEDLNVPALVKVPI